MYVIVWEFHVRTGCEEEFEQVYGQDGEWVQFFRRGDGYLGTALHRDVGRAGRYITIDRWTTQEAYDLFRQRWLIEYADIDRRCESLTEKEVHIGSFASLMGSNQIPG
ncbi:MAG: antibiotic biosynthesis monooxygenase [Ignavibacteria bacterium]|nr:antibiotic biosynthesis monooxygenase [Ignavibacteria bacterium]MBI3766551.1 antibiotic biosynthesis monooxygenase [Ignavibacteriales bacterium]